jgi:hypothetical protein
VLKVLEVLMLLHRSLDLQDRPVVEVQQVEQVVLDLQVRLERLDSLGILELLELLDPLDLQVIQDIQGLLHPLDFQDPLDGASYEQAEAMREEIKELGFDNPVL